MTKEIEELERLKENVERRKPSEEKVWLKQYKEGAFERANDIPNGKTLWDVLEEKLLEFVDVPALEYFKREFSRPDFIEDVYMWARTFKAMGVEEDEVVPIYGPFFPDICAMTCALNMIGASSYFLKLAISKKALEEETANSKIAVVFDGMWENVREVFSDDRFKKILVASPTDALDSVAKKGMLKEHPIETVKSLIADRKTKAAIPMTPKYLWLDDAKAIASYFTGKVKAPFVSDRNAFITSSSGTSISGITKGTIATNESAIAQLLQGYNAEVNYKVGKKCLTNLPPTASTSLNGLFFLALYHGMTALIEPRLSEQGFYGQIIQNRTPVSIMTGSFWEAFFRKVDHEIKKGKTPDLSFSDMFILGGEGPTVEDKAWFDGLMYQCGSKYPMFSGCGMSEVFSVSSVEKLGMTLTAPKKERPVPSVGIAYPGLEVKIVDKNGNELGYNERGEILFRGKSVTKGYYGKPELTAKTIDQDGWLHSGDMYTIDEDGQLYIWGRMADKTTLPNGIEIQLFDIANKIRSNDAIKYSFVNAMRKADGTEALLAHVVFDDTFAGDKKEIYRCLNAEIYEAFPGVSIAGYKEHETTFSASPTTAKKDRNGLMAVLDGYIKPTDNGTFELTLTKNEVTGNYTLHYTPLEKRKILSLIK